MLKRILPPSMHPHLKSYKEASEIWRARVKSMHYGRAVLYFLLFGAVEVATTWIMQLMAPGLNTTYHETLSSFSFIIVATCILSIYSFLLIAIQYRLPGFVAIIISLGSVAAIYWFDIKNRAVLAGARLYPAELRESYHNTAEWASPFLTAATVGMALILVSISIYAKAELTHGLARHGDSFRRTNKYIRWTEEHEGVPKVRHAIRETIKRSPQN